jgi:flagellar hook protein FlgE
MYDSQGSAHALTVNFTKTATNTYTATAQLDNGTATATVTGGPVTFNSGGLLVSPTTLTVALSGISGGAANQTVTLNLGTALSSTGLTQFGGDGASTANATTQDGVAFGTLTSVSFDNAGDVQGTFSNGQTEPIAQLALASFNNQAGLIRTGNNYYQASASSGQALVGTPGSGANGTIEGSSLESSNVDIATEFSRLIIAERGYQVNAETITTADNVLQTLTNIIH